MANFFENRDRRVIPNFRSYIKTVELGELACIGNNTQEDLTNLNDFNTLINDWKSNKTIAHAADLLSATFFNNVNLNTDIIDAAQLIINNKNLTTDTQQKIANKILHNDNLDIINGNGLKKIESFIESNNLPYLFERINSLKKSLIKFPKNPISHVEISRYYSMLGQESQAFKHIIIATRLAPNNRFVTRSAIRLLLHFGDIEIAHEILRNNQYSNKDPWLLAPDISLSIIRDRYAKNAKNGINIINSDNFSEFSKTELTSSIATLELLNGSVKKSRTYFNKSLIQPNDNSLAQAEWASKELSLELDTSKYNVKNSYEANAIDAYNRNQWDLVMNFAENWFIDMPFTKRPILLGSHVAIAFKEDYASSILFNKAGLVSHPNDPQLINNVAFSLAMSNKAKEAEIYINKINVSNVKDIETKICLFATIGLINFRKGDLNNGRLMYRYAISESKKNKSEYFNWLAILNYAREEINNETDFVQEAMGAVSSIPFGKYNDVDELKKKVIALYEKNQIVN